jgi:hypothetical protein
MKIRNRFVSNSSSSSFIVAFKKVPETAEETRELLYGSHRQVPLGTSWAGGKETYTTTTELAEKVFQDIQRQEGKPKVKIPQDVFTAMSWGADTELVMMKRFSHLDQDSEEWDAIYNQLDMLHKLCWEEEDSKTANFLAHHKNDTIIQFSYADDEGPFYSMLEHGGTFNNLPHVRISHH